MLESKNMDKDLQKLETDFVYLQDEVRQLNDIVSSQSAAITKLEKQVDFLAKKVEELDVEARPNRKPPHY